MPKKEGEVETNEIMAEAIQPVDPEPLTPERIEETRGWSDEEYASRHIPDVVENIRRRLESRLPEGSSFSFTSLQREALTTEGFWTCWDRSPSEASHLIVQGSTSSGKTLVSELAILDVLCHEKKAIVLVPLRAMVHERAMQFRQDMDGARHYRVYGSSADYLDNDERIIAGDYDVAVIVYEKFFAMLSSPECHVLDECQLVVVDELSMLSKEDRGPKLEISLEIVANRRPSARIMCLVTSDCRTNLVGRWLNAPIIIRNLSRPVGLDEYVVRTDGHCYHRHIPGENEGVDQGMDETVTEDEGVIEISGFNSEERVRQQKRRALLTILGRVRDEYPESRVLVFVAGKVDTANTARFIRDNAAELYRKVGISESMTSQLATFEHDEDREDLEKNLLPYGIAYHHAGISTALRECIEEEFQRNDSMLKLIVATETLTIGINMPFDVMIMMDHKVPSGAHETHTLTYQEYRNYIGRAGRLGQTNRCGSSYLITTDQQTQEYYWYQYRQVVRTGGDEIESALKGANLETKIPYLLALACDSIGRGSLPQADFDRRLRALHRSGFAHACGSKEFDANRARGTFVRYRLCQEEGADNPFGLEPTISFTNYGEKAAPFALRLSTCQLIYQYFIMDTEFGLPHDAAPTDIIEDRYLLEILYHLCSHEEVENCGNLAMPERGDIVSRIADAIPKRVREIAGEGDGLWARADNPYGSVRELDGSRDFATGIQSPKPKLQAAVRAIVLYWWTKGETISRIRDRSGLKGVMRITGGDVERLASVVSYHLDAIYHAMELTSIDEEVRRQLYWLQARIKYGMPRSGVSLANKHVHGLDRPRILRFIHRCDERGVRPLDVLFTIADEEMEREHFFTREQTLLLRQRNSSRRSGTRFDTILEGAKSESSLTEAQIRCLQEIHNRETLGALETLLELMFTDFDRLSLPRAHWVGGQQCVVELLTDSRKQILIGAWDAATAGEITRVFDEKRRRNPLCVTCCVVDGSVDDVAPAPCGLVLTKGFFDLLLVKSLAFEGNGVYAFESFLSDARGSFSEHDWNDMSISDYFPRQECENPILRFLAHQEDDRSMRALSISALKDAMETSDDLHGFETMTYGSLDVNDPNMTESPLVACITMRDVVRSTNLTNLLNRMRQQNFKNCLVLVPSDEEAERWRNGNCPYDSDPNCLSWYGALASMPAHALRVAHDKDEAIAAIREYVRLWRCEGFLVGVSFSRFEPEKQGGDVERLSILIDSLASRVGRHRVLYCGYPEQLHLFQGRDARPQSLELYKECSLYIVLDNLLTEQSTNCREERAVIDERCLSGEAACLYIGGTVPGGIATDDDYVTPIGIDPAEFADLAVSKLGTYGTANS